jgi:hypothetical protein
MRREYIRTANELKGMILMLHTRSRAATTIQSAWRGWRQRQTFLPVWRQHLEQKSALVLQRVSFLRLGGSDSDGNACAFCSSCWCGAFCVMQPISVMMADSLLLAATL